jgi:hypothetical protein
MFSIPGNYALALATLFYAAPLLAQSYPVKPVRIVIPYPPGGVDITIRQILPYMDQSWGNRTSLTTAPVRAASSARNSYRAPNRTAIRCSRPRPIPG